jgi:hypothetical protein
MSSCFSRANVEGMFLPELPGSLSPISAQPVDLGVSRIMFDSMEYSSFGSTWFYEYPLGALHTLSLTREIQNTSTFLSAHVTDAIILSYQSHDTCAGVHTRPFSTGSTWFRDQRVFPVPVLAVRSRYPFLRHSAARPCEVPKSSFRHALVQLNRKDRPLQVGLWQGGRGHRCMSNKRIHTHLGWAIATWHFWTRVVAQ